LLGSSLPSLGRSTAAKSTREKEPTPSSNQPYDREQEGPADASVVERKGGWVRYGDPDDPNNRPIVRDFIDPASTAGAAVHVKNLYNVYVYFWRWALWKLFENPEANGPGIISFITASSYLRGPGFVGMRQKMREAFDELWILDLEGDQHGARKTENVFAIQTPVAIAIGVRYGDARPQTPAQVRYARITGPRDEKLAKLRAIHRFDDVQWQDCVVGWMQPFLPRGEGDYHTWPLLTDIFPWQHSGSQFKRTWPIGETPELLEARWRALLAVTGEERRRAFRESRDRKIERQYSSLDGSGRRLPTISSLTPNTAPIPSTRYAFRSFDRQWALPDPRVGDFLRPALWHVQSNRQIYLTSILADVLGLGPAATVTAYIPDLHHFSGRGGKDIIPLYRDAEATHPNLQADLLTRMTNTLRRDVTAEDFFCYAYSILATPAYVETFSEELTIPGPRLPITRSRTLFARAVELGRRLIWLHTYGDRFVPPRRQRGQIPQGQARCRRGVPTTPAGYPENFSYESTSQVLRIGEGIFSPVAEAVWNFKVSGLQVVESWLNYRMRAGAGRTSSPLDEIRPDRWIGALTQELLELLWVLEATVSMLPDLKEVFDGVIGGETFRADELPQPTPNERRAPGDEEHEATQHEMNL